MPATRHIYKLITINTAHVGFHFRKARGEFVKKREDALSTQNRQTFEA